MRFRLIKKIIIILVIIINSAMPQYDSYENEIKKKFGDNAIMITNNGKNKIYFIGFGLHGVSEKYYYIEDTVCKMYQKISNIHKSIFFGMCAYFFIASFFERIAKKIVNINLYNFFNEVNMYEMKAMLNKMERTIDLEFIINLKKIKRDIDFLFNYKYAIYPFVFFPFFHTNLKKVMFFITILYEKVHYLDSELLKN